MNTTAIVDSHCHAWETWPYPPQVPDPSSRGCFEQLLYEMDVNGVDQALIVCAQIEHNPANNAYIAQAVASHPGRLFQVADLDSEWAPTYHTPGSAQRLREMAARWPLKGFTHYLRRDEDGSWLTSPEGLALFSATRELGLLASLACYPHHQPAVRGAALRFPEVPFLVHHLGQVHHGLGAPSENLEQVLASARVPNIYLKVSGFGYPAAHAWEYPYPAARETLHAEYDAFGPNRLVWGSDYPVVRYYMTYRQSLEVLRMHCDFIPSSDLPKILGATLSALMNRSRA
jgi:predicted TIM-barrel fold metal-dependent hydrolase